MRGLFSVKKSVPHICAVKLTESFISPNEEKNVSLQSKIIYIYYYGSINKLLGSANIPQKKAMDNP